MRSDVKTQRRFPTLQIVFCSVLLFPSLSSSQRPPSPGKLLVTSDPPGASITIDNQSMGHSTNYMFVVSPGEHSVAVKSTTLQNCATPAKVTVPSGSRTTINCRVAGWDPPITE